MRDRERPGPSENQAIHGHAPPYILDLIRTRERTTTKDHRHSYYYNLIMLQNKKDIGRQSISSCVSGTVERSPK